MKTKFQSMLLLVLVVPLLSVKAWNQYGGCQEFAYQSWSVVGPYCAKYFSDPLTFGEAEVRCRGKHPNGHLISVHDRITNYDLKLLTGGASRAWVGGQRLPCTTNSFIWTDGSEWDYQNWSQGQPDGSGNCVQINWSSPGMFDDTTCCSELPYICAFLPSKQ